MPDADNTKDTPRNGRRATDNQPNEGVFPSKNSGLFRWLINGITVGGVITAIFIGGRASKSLDTTVKKVDRHDVYIVKMMEKQTELMLAIKENTVNQKRNNDFLDKFFDQQGESDKEFLDVIKDIREGVQDNSKDIIILQQKISMLDNTYVELAMR